MPACPHYKLWCDESLGSTFLPRNVYHDAGARTPGARDRSVSRTREMVPALVMPAAPSQVIRALAGQSVMPAAIAMMVPSLSWSVPSDVDPQSSIGWLYVGYIQRD